MVLAYGTRQAINFAARGEKVFNTSVAKGKLNGVVTYTMAFEMSSTTTPGGWNTFFATAG